MFQESLQDEIKWLEGQLEAKKQSLEGKEGREALKEVIKEAGEMKLLPPPPSGASLSDDAAQQAAQDLKEKEHKEIVEDLVGIAFTKGIAQALKTANALRNPHLLDEFHDTLADKYYAKLLAARKIKS